MGTMVREDASSEEDGFENYIQRSYFRLDSCKPFDCPCYLDIFCYVMKYGNYGLCGEEELEDRENSCYMLPRETWFRDQPPHTDVNWTAF